MQHSPKGLHPMSAAQRPPISRVPNFSQGDPHMHPAFTNQMYMPPPQIQGQIPNPSSHQMLVISI